VNQGQVLARQMGPPEPALRAWFEQALGAAEGAERLQRLNIRISRESTTDSKIDSSKLVPRGA
jgi:hypothetical protein